MWRPEASLYLVIRLLHFSHTSANLKSNGAGGATWVRWIIDRTWGAAGPRDDTVGRDPAAEETTEGAALPTLETVTAPDEPALLVVVLLGPEETVMEVVVGVETGLFETPVAIPSKRKSQRCHHVMLSRRP